MDRDRQKHTYGGIWQTDRVNEVGKLNIMYGLDSETDMNVQSKQLFPFVLIDAL